MEQLTVMYRGREEFYVEYRKKEYKNRNCKTNGYTDCRYISSENENCWLFHGVSTVERLKTSSEK